MLSTISRELQEQHHQPIDPGVSLQLQADLQTKLKEMRAQGALNRRAFAAADAAIAAVRARIDALGAEAVFEVYAAANASGFFSGQLSSEFLRACLQRGYEGLVAVLPDLVAGVILDVAFDDPLHGNFYEVLSW
jgi:hypothetical protein